jgi:hypothetical protein
MASISISTVREQYPGKTDAEAAARIAEEGGYVIVVRYKLMSDGPFTNFGLCWTYAEADNYLFNQNLHDVEVIYDRRNTAQAIPKVLHNAQAIKRSITFGEDGRASEPCCWNCRHFTITLSSSHLCCKDQMGRGVVEVERGDLCDFWKQRTVF